MKNRLKQLFKPFTLMVIPHSGKQVRSISISKQLIALVAFSIFLVGGGSGYFLYKFSEYRRSSQELNQYKAETERIRNEYDSMADTAEAMKQKLDSLQKLENDLRAKNGLPQLPDNSQTDGGKGGVLQSRSGLKRPTLILNKEALDQLNKETDQRIESAKQILTTIEQQEAEQQAEETQKQDKEAHTPTIWPTGSRTISSDFGYRLDPFDNTYSLHTGLDIAGSYGSPVQATADGVITEAGWDGGYGICIMVDHGNGIVTRYGHLSAVDVKTGQTVKKGDTIGRIGSTGRSTGPHLHYEITVSGNLVNPVKYLP
ncbi:M23 family metallopeptidase [Effusibacillus dendaii]|uniref:Peptidase M23 n=1 Tax=Effusibacillus dendaii TaxID=2743772 RepID=A0A7I8DB42_9BACL|nr:M23 family metallopeptidase [Effusibacillus dendaii]BCJ86562.1 peptidase M23 [Effusibacillus dendaii]